MGNGVFHCFFFLLFLLDTGSSIYLIHLLFILFFILFILLQPPGWFGACSSQALTHSLTREAKVFFFFFFLL